MDFTAEDWRQSLASIATTLLDGNPIAILLALIVTISLPVALHYFIYRRAASPSLSTFVLLGPSGAGKTAFLSLVESTSLPKPKTSLRDTHTSQTSISTTVTLPYSVPVFSNRYRSVNDPSLTDAKRNAVKYVLRDTPGHGKLRSAQLSQLLTELNSKKKSEASSIRGILFFVDAASLAEDAETLRDCAGYLYDTLLVLQKVALAKAKGRRSTGKSGEGIAVLVAANKQDLFTALPPGSVKQKLESEIDRIRQTRQRGLLDASAGLENRGVEDENDEVLGQDDDVFTFQSLEDDIGLKVEVIGGSAKAENEKETANFTGTRKWEEWIGSCL